MTSGETSTTRKSLLNKRSGRPARSSSAAPYWSYCEATAERISSFVSALWALAVVVISVSPPLILLSVAFTFLATVVAAATATTVEDCSLLPQSQYDALQDLYDATNGPHWCASGDDWNFSAASVQNTSAPCTDEWSGVYCNCTASTGQFTVEALELDSFCLNGTVPSSIRDLVDLESLSLRYNDNLSGTIQEAIFELSGLQYLYLESNRLVGSIPESIANASSLREVILDGNFLTNHIPTSIGELTQLIILSAAYNSLSGSLPSSIGRMESLMELVLYNNHLTGSIPSSIGSLKMLHTLNLFSNSITGTLPIELYNITTLTSLDLLSNRFTGTIAAAVGQLDQLWLLSLGDSLFTGSIPNSIASLTVVQELDIPQNYLTGSLPSYFDDLVLLIHFDVDENYITGSIPDELAEAPSLRVILTFSNFFTGTISSAFGKASLIGFSSYGNLLTGTIPPELCDASLLALFLYGNSLTGTVPGCLCELPLMGFTLYSNFLTGTVPSNIGDLAGIQGIEFYDNYFTGSIPTSLNLIASLIRIDFSYNYLTGSFSATLLSSNEISIITLSYNMLTQLIPGGHRPIALTELIVDDNLLSGAYFERFNSSLFPQLQVINVANNLLSGSIPESFFLNLPSLSGLSTSSNCFTGSLPDSVCQLENVLSVLDMSGVGSNPGCSQNQQIQDHRPPFVDGTLQAATLGLRGTIPSCLLSFPALELLHLSDNNLVGTIPSITINSNSDSSILTELVLSNNALTGTIPLSVQRHDFSSLDLSNNRLRGTLVDDFRISPSQSSLALAVNRLSGPLPSTFKGLSSSTSMSSSAGNSSGSSQNATGLSSLNVLASNIFSCSAEDIPSLDKYAQSYSCGSYELDVAAYAWLAVLGVFVATGLAVAAVRRVGRVSLLDGAARRTEQAVAAARRWWELAASSSSSSSSSIRRQNDEERELAAFLAVLRLVRAWTLVTGALLVLVVIPVYAGLDPVSSIVSYDYGYVVSVAFLHGVAPVAFVGALELILLVVSGQALDALRMVFERSVKRSGSSVKRSGSSVTATAGTGSAAHEPKPLTEKVPEAATSTSSNVVAASASTEICSESPQQDQHQTVVGATRTADIGTATDPLIASTLHKYSVLAALHIINLVVTVSVNAAYVSAILSGSTIARSQLLVIQVCLGLFKLAWNALYIPWCVRRLSAFMSQSRGMQNRFVMSITNFVVAPCIATLVVNQSCFYYVFNENDSAVSVVTLDICVSFLGIECLLYSPVSFYTSSSPAFHYSYACGTALLESYTPVLLYSYIAYGFAAPVTRYWIASNSAWLTDLIQKYKTKTWTWLWLLPSAVGGVKGRDVVATLMLHATVLLTFGVASPLLGVCIVVAMVNDCNMTRLLTGRLLELDHQHHQRQQQRQHETGPNSTNVRALDLHDAWQGLFRCFWPVALTVSSFYALLFFDMIADGYGSAVALGVCVPYGVLVPAAVAVMIAWTRKARIAARQQITSLERTLESYCGFVSIEPGSAGADATTAAAVAAEDEGVGIDHVYLSNNLSEIEIGSLSGSIQNPLRPSSEDPCSGREPRVDHLV